MTPKDAMPTPGSTPGKGEPGLGPASALVRQSLGLLQRMYDEQSHLFSFSTRVLDGRLVNDFEHSGRYRYTVNVMAGLARFEACHGPSMELDKILDAYLECHLINDPGLGNRGLLLHVLAEREHPAATRLYTWLAGQLEQRIAARGRSVQELAWVALGLTSFAARFQQAAAAGLAGKLIRHLRDAHMHPRTLLPKHDQSLRGDFVSFGGLTYFLMALAHYAVLMDDSAIRALFCRAVSMALSLQGEDGAWPWFLDVKRGKISDWYPIFSVHQDAMAPLFLFPALAMKVAGAEAAIEKSYRWLLGANPLGVPFMSRTPFFIYRSLGAAHWGERPLRLMRGFTARVLGTSARQAAPDRLSINRECRSYHLGWLLYAWSGRSDFTEFSEAPFQATAVLGST